jgi:hypothetical protein
MYRFYAESENGKTCALLACYHSGTSQGSKTYVRPYLVYSRRTELALGLHQPRRGDARLARPIRCVVSLLVHSECGFSTKILSSSITGNLVILPKRLARVDLPAAPRPRMTTRFMVFSLLRWSGRVPASSTCPGYWALVTRNFEEGELWPRFRWQSMPESQTAS